MIIEELADFAVMSRTSDLAGEVRDAATRATIDWFGATIAGSTMEPAEKLRRAFAHLEGSGRSTLVPSGTPMEPRTAAMINGTASHTAELDDIYREGIYHPGSPTVAAALAAGQHLAVSGERFLRGVAVGYEIGDRIAEAVQPAHYTYWHTTGTAGAIGAAAAVAEIMALDTEQFAHALATATTMAAGLQQAFRSDAMSKPLHAGHGADSGIVAAFSAAAGFTGALDILEGAAGFGAAMSEEVDWDHAVGQLGSPWGITQATVKNHSCCGHTFAAVDAALELLEEGIDVDVIDSIRIETYSTAIKVAGNIAPSTAFEAKFSLSYCVAAALRVGSVRLDAFTPERLEDPELRSLMDRTQIEAVPEFDIDFPSRRRARVTLRMRDGSSLTQMRNTRKGDPDDPLSDEELQQKFDELASAVIGADRAEHVACQLRDIAHLDDLSVLGTSN